MKFVPKMPIPWDMVVFLTITSVGFGFSVQRLVNNPSSAVGATRELASASSSSLATSTSLSTVKDTVVDLGCLERRLGGEKWTTAKNTVRMRGKFCNLSRRAMRNFQGMRILNVSTGFEGTTFLQGREPAFVTDDVVLRKGKNLIQIEWRETADNSPKTWTAEVYED